MVDIPFLAQVKNFTSNRDVRAMVLDRILHQLPSEGEIVIVAHSLGSVIAADLLPRLPKAVTVAGMVTIGSPLATGAIDVRDIVGKLDDPPQHLRWWVNVWDSADVIAAMRGLSSQIPWLLDFRIRTGAVALGAHSAERYLGHPIVARIIGFALHGSLSREVAITSRAINVSLDPAERYALLALRYAHLLKDRLDGDTRARCEGALRHIQSQDAQQLISMRSDANRPCPEAIERLSVDLGDPESVARTPMTVAGFDRDELVVPLLVLAASNVFDPFEIQISRAKQVEAMKNLCVELGLKSQLGTDVFEATKQGQSVLRGPGTLIRWAVVGAGLGAIVVATGGLALAAAPGLAGAAAITSALAAFGPGGMVGGLLTAGTLVSAGGGTVAYGLANVSVSAEVFEDVVERRVATAILRKMSGLEPDAAVWFTLTEVEIELRREHERLDEYSDRNAPSLRALKKKIAIVERALRFLLSESLGPQTTEEVEGSKRPQLQLESGEQGQPST
ncbi:hypothetical protein [Microcella putealis]|uniref:hypothetical protein n=1 Tax=Microcella putealis TaxID=337005 RepID=UPI001639D585|nr:hypothetical protein [Microcella putealis]